MICCLYASRKLTVAKLWTNMHAKEGKGKEKRRKQRGCWVISITLDSPSELVIFELRPKRRKELAVWGRKKKWPLLRETGWAKKEGKQIWMFAAAAAAAKSFQSRLTLHDPIDSSLPCSSVHGILQAIVLEWVAIAFSFECLSNWKKVQWTWIKSITLGRIW